MGAATIKFDNTLKKSEIIIPLVNVSHDAAGGDYSNEVDVDQTKVYGVISPLIMICNTVIDFDSILSFDLDSTGILPSLSMTVIDKNKTLSNIDKPKYGDEVRVQILPKFDNAYKKIDLTFYISSIEIEGKFIELTGIYKAPKLTTTRFMTLGKYTTYDVFANIALFSGLGFATNVVSTNDAQYVYCNNISLLQTLNNVISTSDTSTHILDWWIDFWDNVNLVDIKERYTSIDSDDDMMIWIADNANNTSASVKTEPVATIAAINNHPAFESSELYVSKYNQVISPGIQLSGGTDTVFTVYNESDNAQHDYLAQDGDIKNNIVTTYKYLGENYAEYNYLFSKIIRQLYFAKMNSEYIEVTLNHPLLALTRGGKVNYIHYVNDDFVENKIKNLEDAGLVDRNVESNINLDPYTVDSNNSDGQFRIDKTVSGQYLINGIEISYHNKQWEYVLKLVKPASSKVSILNIDNDNDTDKN